MRRAIPPAGGAPRRPGERPLPAARAARAACATRPLGRTLHPCGAGAAAAAGRLVHVLVGAGRAARRRRGRGARTGGPAAGRGVSAAGRGRCAPWRAARRRSAPASPPLLCSSVCALTLPANGSELQAGRRGGAERAEGPAEGRQGRGDPHLCRAGQQGRWRSMLSCRCCATARRSVCGWGPCLGPFQYSDQNRDAAGSEPSLGPPRAAGAASPATAFPSKPRRKPLGTELQNRGRRAGGVWGASMKGVLVHRTPRSSIGACLWGWGGPTNSKLYMSASAFPSKTLYPYQPSETGT